MVVGLLPPTAGRVTFDGIDMWAPAREAERQKLRRRLQMIFQDPFASLNPRWRVDRIIADPIRAFGLTADRAETEARVGELLRLVGLDPADGVKYPHEFSGGQRQRICIARALSSNPDFIVCDEPTSALDVSVQAQILNLMRDLQDQLGLAYLFISHNLAVVRHMATRIGVMYLGRIVEIAPANELFEAPRHPYTRALIDALPDLAMSGRERKVIEGEIPNPIDPPPGCAFHPRCPLAFERCRSELPLLLPHGDAPGRLPRRRGGQGLASAPASRGLAAARVVLQHALRGGRRLGQLLLRPHGPAHQLAAAVRAASAGQAIGRAIGAEGAFERADQGIRRIRRQILVAAFAVGSQGEHAILPMLLIARRLCGR